MDVSQISWIRLMSMGAPRLAESISLRKIYWWHSGGFHCIALFRRNRDFFPLFSPFLTISDHFLFTFLDLPSDAYNDFPLFPGKKLRDFLALFSLFLPVCFLIILYWDYRVLLCSEGTAIFFRYFHPFWPYLIISCSPFWTFPPMLTTIFPFFRAKSYAIF